MWITGPDYQKCLDNYDIVFKSPGIVLERPIEEHSYRIVSQTEVFFQCFFLGPLTGKILIEV